MLNPVEVITDLFKLFATAFKEFEEAKQDDVIDTTPLAEALLAFIETIVVKLPSWVNVEITTKVLNVVFGLLKEHKAKVQAS